MKVLVINAGSSSLKYQCIDMETECCLAKGMCDRIGIDDGFFKQSAGEKYVEKQVDIPDHATAIRLVLRYLTDSKFGVISDISQIAAVGHRVVNGGEIFPESTLLNEEKINKIEELTDFAPLHNPPAVTGMRACVSVMGKDIPQVAVFDTSFHQTMPEHAFLYSIPYKYYENDKLRRYGFHGTSHRYVSMRAAALLGRDIKDLKIVSCHLGNGASLAAIDGGRCVDTSMGLTPLAGLPMGTRAGDMDAGVVEFIANKYNRTVSDVMTGLNKRSGMLGVSGVSSDFRDLHEAAAQGHHRSMVALQIFEYRVHKMIAEYAAAMNGVDVVVFTAGVGENSKDTRAGILKGLDFMGITCDEKKNDVRGEERIISKDGAPVSVVVVPTNEELMIAQDTMELVQP